MTRSTSTDTLLNLTRSALIGVAALMFLSTGTASAAGDAAAGQGKSAVCAACHGADGKALQPSYPNLAGQHPAYLAKQLTDYREGNRVNALMTGQAANLTDQDILDLAAYFSEMTAIQGVASEDNLSMGEAIYRGGITGEGVPACIACHGPTGQGNPASAYPVIAGQNVQYITDQLNLWRAGERVNDPNEMMSMVAHRLTDTEIAAVANYVQGLYSAAN